MIEYKKIINDFLYAAFAQGMGLFLGFVTSLVVPKILSLEAFGYWQLFIFYTTYVGLFHFGLNDGVYLLKGGQTRCEMNDREVGSQFLFGTLFQTLIAILIAFLALMGKFDPNREFVIFATAGFLIISNANSYLGLVLQALNETRRYSLSLIVNQVVFLVAIFVLLLNGIEDFRLYVLCYLIAKFLSLAYCLRYLKNIFSQGLLKFHETSKLALCSIRIGIKLTIANVASMLIFGIVRFSVDAAWGIETFGQLSLAISLMNFVLTFFAQVGMVLFPALRRADNKEIAFTITKLRDGSYLLFSAIYVLYVPIAVLLTLWLPQYQQAVVWFAILLPACVFDGKMNVCYSTYFKVMRQEKKLLYINLGTVLLSACSVAFSVVVLQSAEAAIVSGVIAVTVRSLFSEYTIFKELGAQKKVRVGDSVLGAIFIGTILLLTDFMVIEAVCLLAYTVYLLINRKILKQTISCKL